jgi:hypothetical protein
MDQDKRASECVHPDGCTSCNWCGFSGEKPVEVVGQSKLPTPLQLSIPQMMAQHQMNVECKLHRNEVLLSISSFCYWESSEVQTYAASKGAEGYSQALEAAIISFMQANKLQPDQYLLV